MVKYLPLLSKIMIQMVKIIGVKYRGCYLIVENDIYNGVLLFHQLKNAILVLLLNSQNGWSVYERT